MGVSSSKHSTGMLSCCKSYFASFSVLSRTFYTEICNVALHRKYFVVGGPNTFNDFMFPNFVHLYRGNYTSPEVTVSIGDYHPAANAIMSIILDCSK